MTSINLEDGNEIDYHYPGYIVRAKNTFIDITPKRSMIRSRSCIATFGSYDFKDSKAKAPLGVCATPITPSTNCSSLSDGNNRGPFALALGRYDGLDSCGSDAVDNEDFDSR